MLDRSNGGALSPHPGREECGDIREECGDRLPLGEPVRLQASRVEEIVQQGAVLAVKRQGGVRTVSSLGMCLARLEARVIPRNRPAYSIPRNRLWSAWVPGAGLGSRRWHCGGGRVCPLRRDDGRIPLLDGNYILKMTRPEERRSVVDSSRGLRGSNRPREVI